MRRPGSSGVSPTAAVYVSIVVVILAGGAFLTLAQSGAPGTTQTSSSSTSGSGMQGVVAGFVTVGPSQPVCRANESCNVNLSGYAVVFTPQCAGEGQSCQPSLAPLSPAGHYSALLPEGNYTVTGLSPSCQWVGCSSAFPRAVFVQGGMQIELDFSIDTGIR